MLMRSSTGGFLAGLQKVRRRQRAPVLLVRIRRRLALNRADGFLDLLRHFGPPAFEGPRIRPSLPQQMFLGHFQTVAAERRLFQFRVHIIGDIMFTMAAEAEQTGDDHLRTATFAKRSNSLAKVAVRKWS